MEESQETAPGKSQSASGAKKKASSRKRKGGAAKKGRARTLVIVESPAKAKTIHKYLGKNYIIEASMGHIIDLPKSRMAVDVDQDFQPEYITVRGRASILNRLKKLAGSAERVLLAADPDREGEAISWHLSRALGKLNGDIKRIEFNEITKTALEEAIKKPREINQDLVNAQQARRILDRLVGYNISPLLWKKIKRGLSAGRVQSVALRLICSREAEIDRFTPEEYWTLEARLAHGKDSFKAALHSLDGKKAAIGAGPEMQAIVDELQDASYAVRSVSVKERKRQPTAPYTTSKMQQDSANKLGFTSQKTMMVAQQLYEGIELEGGVATGLITYMRTDSTRVSPQAIEHVREFIAGQFGREYLSAEPRVYKTSRSAQDAHEAIRPTDPAWTPDRVAPFLSRDQMKLYQLVWQKFVSSQMSDEIADHTSVDIAAGRAIFRATGRTVKFPGFARVFGGEEGERDEKSEKADKKKKEALLPPLAENDPLQLKKLEPEQHFTQPPPRYTDASMVKALEECGVGRPSTYAPTLSTLLKRYYVTRLQRALKPTELGRMVDRIMGDHFPDLINTSFTAQMEDNLDRVARNDLDWVEMLRSFYGPFAGVLKNAHETIGEMKNALDEPTDHVCEKCGRNMVKKLGRKGYFLACPGFPECRNAKPIPLGPCPKCADGQIIQRSTKRGRAFFGCSRYPECDFSTWDKPAEHNCPQCGKLLFEKSSRERGRYVACAACSYEEAASQSA
ncbi:MAG: type I DNA topoisomerase [Leptospirales bacterium]|nr:type I DNA topoisomerase [Leptospirales bacterium]